MLEMKAQGYLLSYSSLKIKRNRRIKMVWKNKTKKQTMYIIDFSYESMVLAPSQARDKSVQALLFKRIKSKISTDLKKLDVCILAFSGRMLQGGYLS